MKKSINIAIYNENIPLDEVFAGVKAAGFQAVELNMRPKKVTSPDLYLEVPEAEILEIKTLLEKHGLECAGLVTSELWKYCLTSDDCEAREQGKKRIRKMIDICVLLGADSVLVVPGVVNGEVTYKNAYHNALESLKELAPYAEKNKVYLGVEDVWNKFLLSPYEMADFVDKVGSDYVGVYFDAGNVQINSWPEYWIEILGKRITRIHVKGFNNANNSFCGLWEGTIRWDKVVTELRKIGYDGYITGELWTDKPIDEALTQISADITKIIEL